MPAKKDNRTYIRLHDGMPDHPKIVGLSNAGFRAYIEVLCWCARHLTDGRIPNAAARRLGSVKTLRELVTAGLIREFPDGLGVHDYLQHQRSANEVSDMRERRQNAGKLGGTAKAKGLANARRVAKQNAGIDRDIEIDKEGQELSSEVAARPDVEHLCDLLADLIEANGSKRPTVTARWRDSCRLLVDVDLRTVAQVENAIRWCQGDEFWRGNVLSMPKLREKYDQLRHAANRQNAPPKARASTTDAAVAGTYELAAKYADMNAGGSS